MGFRYFTLKEAEKLGISGYVRNLPNGDVEVVYKPLNLEVEQIFLEKLKKGPFLARVKDIEKREISVNNELSGFKIIH